MTRKKTITLLIILILLVAGAVLAYYFFVKPISQEKEQESKETEVVPITTSPAETKKLLQLTEEAVISPAIDEKNNIIKYLTIEGSLYTMNLDGKDKKQEPFVALDGLIKALWSPDSSSFVNIYADTFGVRRFFYDLKERKTSPLNRNINWIDYSKTKDQIIYHFEDPVQGTNTIASANPDGSSPRTIINTRIKDIRLAWVTDDKISITTAPSGLSENILYYTKVTDPKLIRVVSGVHGLTAKWSDDGNRVIFSRTNGNGSDLRLMSTKENGLDIKDTGISTLPEKCVFSDDNVTVFCAEPSDIPDSAIIPDDYYKKTFFINDRIWKMDLESGKKDIIYEFRPDSDLDITDMILAKNNTLLYFINRTTGLFYRLEL